MSRHNFLTQAKSHKRPSTGAAARKTISLISLGARRNLRKAVLVSLLALAGATTVAVSSYIETRQSATDPPPEAANAGAVARGWTLQFVSRNASASQQNTYAEPFQLLSLAQSDSDSATSESLFPGKLSEEGEGAAAGEVAEEAGGGEPSEPAAGEATAAAEIEAKDASLKPADGPTEDAESDELKGGAEPATEEPDDQDAALASPQEPPPSPPAAPISPAAHGLQISHFITNVNVTFYDCLAQGFCGHMYGGKLVYEGAAACSWNLPLGTMFTIVGDPTQRVYICEDRGLLADTWVDIFWYDPADGWIWQASVGRYATIEILVAP